MLRMYINRCIYLILAIDKYPNEHTRKVMLLLICLNFYNSDIDGIYFFNICIPYLAAFFYEPSLVDDIDTLCVIQKDETQLASWL